MGAVRLHLRFARELLPGASLDECRQLYLVPQGCHSVGDVRKDIAEQWCLRHDVVMAIAGSRVRNSTPCEILRDNDVMELVSTVAAVPRHPGETLCSSCDCSDPADFSDWQWKKLCSGGTTARCKACVARDKTMNTVRSVSQDLNTHASALGQEETTACQEPAQSVPSAHDKGGAENCRATFDANGVEMLQREAKVAATGRQEQTGLGPDDEVSEAYGHPWGCARKTGGRQRKKAREQAKRQQVGAQGPESAAGEDLVNVNANIIRSPRADSAGQRTGHRRGDKAVGVQSKSELEAIMWVRTNLVCGECGFRPDPGYESEDMMKFVLDRHGHMICIECQDWHDAYAEIAGGHNKVDRINDLVDFEESAK